MGSRVSRLEGGLNFSVRSSVRNRAASFESGVSEIQWNPKLRLVGVSEVNGNVIRTAVHVDSDVERAQI